MGPGVSGDDIPDEHSVCRVIKASQFDPDALSAQPAAFLRTEKDLDGLSVNWVEFVHHERDQALAQILIVLRQKREVKASQRFATVRVDAARQKAQERNVLGVTIRHSPEALPAYDHDDPSHSLVSDYSMDLNMLVAEAIAESVVAVSAPVGPQS
jgi:hypothetical protein